MKIFHYMKKIDSLQISQKEIISPIHIRIKPTNICNHNCKYCAYRSDNLQLGKDMKQNDVIPKDKMFEIIDDLNEMNVKAVTFSGGGDPFCYPYLIDAIKKISKTNIKFAALTNGSKLEGEIAELFSNYGTWIRISIDGWDQQSYADYRNTSIKGFENVISNIINFKKLKGKCFLGASIIVDKHNNKHLTELSLKLSEAGVDSIKFSPCIVDNDAEKNNEYHRLIYDTVKDQISKVKEKLKSHNIEIFDSYHLLNAKFNKNYDWCPYIQILPIIGADCNVYSCQDKAYNLEKGIIGSIKSKSFKEFWFEDKKKFFLINPSVDCLHHCISNEKNNLILQYINSDKDHLEFV